MDFPLIPEEYLREAENIPDFWVTDLGDIAAWLACHVSRGEIREIGRSAGGRPIPAVTFGEPRKGARTTSFSGSIGARKLAAYFGIPIAVGTSFGLLAISTFLLTTLDTATRLCRYVFQEFTGLIDPRWRFVATGASLMLPAILVFITIHGADGAPLPAWKAIWPAFGATNQLLGALALMVIAVWLRSIGRSYLFVALPMLFMMVMTIWSLVGQVMGGGTTPIVRAIAGTLLVMALVLVGEGIRVFSRPRPTPAPM